MWLFLLCPNQTLVADDSIFKQVHAFSEWILLGCQRCPLPSWAHWRNNSGIELLFVLVFTMVFKVISLNDSPCLWSVQVPCRCLAHPPISLDVLLYRLWFKFVLPVIIWSNFARYGLFPCRPALMIMLSGSAGFPGHCSLRASPGCPIGIPWSYQKKFLTSFVL